MTYYWTFNLTLEFQKKNLTLSRSLTVGTKVCILAFFFIRLSGRKTVVSLEFVSAFNKPLISIPVYRYQILSL